MTAILSLLIALAGPALPGPTPLRAVPDVVGGAIIRFTGDRFLIRARTGQQVEVPVSGGVRVLRHERVHLSDLRLGEYVQVAARETPALPVLGVTAYREADQAVPPSAQPPRGVVLIRGRLVSTAPLAVRDRTGRVWRFTARGDTPAGLISAINPEEALPGEIVTGLFPTPGFGVAASVVNLGPSTGAAASRAAARRRETRLYRIERGPRTAEQLAAVTDQLLRLFHAAGIPATLSPAERRGDGAALMITAAPSDHPAIANFIALLNRAPAPQSGVPTNGASEPSPNE